MAKLHPNPTNGFSFAIERRSGGRDEDRATLFAIDGCTVIAIADGAGGTGGGADAADCVMTEAEALFRGERDSAAVALATADHEIGRWGAQSTGIIVEIRDGQIRGACVGDSAAWLLTDGDYIDLTENQPRKPLLGDGAMPGGIWPTPARGRVLLATDGLTKYANNRDIVRIAWGIDLDESARQLVELPRLRDGSWPDDVAAVLICFD